MRNTLRSIALALALSLPVAGMATLSGCAAVSGIFESDPVGASLITIKASYESTVRTAGRLYVEGVISEAELRKFRDQAVKFHKNYTALVALHAEGKLTNESDPKLTNLIVALTALETIVADFSS